MDERPVINEEIAKSIGKENTFAVDYTDRESCRDEVLDLCGQVGWCLRREHFSGRTVTLKVKFADFHTITRSVSSDRPICWDEEIFSLAEKLLQTINVKPGVRLLGVTVSGLDRPEDTPVLGFAEDERLRARNRAVDQLKSRFGESIIKRGILK